MKKGWHTLWLTLLTLLVSVCLVSQHQLIQWQRPVISFDMQGTIHAFAKQVHTLHDAPKKQAKLVTQFSQTLLNVVNDYAATHHVTIVLSQATVAGAPDRTLAIQTAISEQMKKDEKAGTGSRKKGDG